LTLHRPTPQVSTKQRTQRDAVFPGLVQSMD
jgi:hypothetical protein